MSASPEARSSAAARDAEPVPGRPFPWQFTTPLFIGSALNPVNSSLIATALLPIAHGLGVSVGQTAALVTALYLATAVAQPTAGKAAEVLGPRRVFLAGIVLVGAGGLIGGFAQDLLTLVISRVLIGLGTSCAYPTAMLLIRRRAREGGLDQPPGAVLGGLQIAGIATASLGLPVGGVLVGLLGWRSVFFVNAPVALVALAAALAWVEPDGPLNRPLRLRDLAARLDVGGIVGFAAAMIALLLFLFGLPATHWYLLGISAALWLTLVFWELRAATPFLDLRMLVSNKALSRTYLRFGLAMLCIYVVLYGLTQWLEAVRGLTETEAGLLMLPMTLVSGLVVFPVSRRNLVRGPVIAAAVVSVIGAAGTLTLSGSSWIGWVVVVTLIFGLVTGFSASGNQSALYVQAPPEQLGTAAGLLRTFGYVGSIASSAIIGIVFRTNVSDSGVHLIAWIMVGVGLVLALISVLDRTLPRTTGSLSPSEPASGADTGTGEQHHRTRPTTIQEDTVPVERLNLTAVTADGVADAYLARPVQRDRNPGVLLLVDGFGLRPQIEQMADRIAARGYAVLAPNVFYRAGRAPVVDLDGLDDPGQRATIIGRIMPLVNELTPERVVSDGAAYLDLLQQYSSGPAAITGYCMGGRLGWRIATAYPERVAALAAFHTGGLVTDGPDSPHLAASRLAAEVFFGHADNDPSMTHDHISALEQALNKVGATYRSEVFHGADHGYTMNDTAAYNEAAAERHYAELFALLERTSDVSH